MSKSATDGTINDGEEELRGDNVDNIVDVEVLCDGSWQWRGQSSKSFIAKY